MKGNWIPLALLFGGMFVWGMSGVGLTQQPGGGDASKKGGDESAVREKTAVSIEKKFAEGEGTKFAEGVGEKRETTFDRSVGESGSLKRRVQSVLQEIYSQPNAAGGGNLDPVVDVDQYGRVRSLSYRKTPAVRSAGQSMMMAPGNDMQAGDATVQKLNQEDWRLEQQVNALIVQLRLAGNEQTKQETRMQLSGALAGQFDVRQKRREREIELIEERVKKLRGGLQKREAAKRDIVNMRLLQIVQEVEGLGWGGDAVPVFDAFGTGLFGGPTAAEPAVQPPTDAFLPFPEQGEKKGPSEPVPGPEATKVDPLDLPVFPNPGIEKK